MSLTEAANGVSSGHRFSLRVYYEDTDAGGVVYHANYLKFLERARTELLHACGGSFSSIQTCFGLSFVIKSVNIDFFKPARLQDQLDVLTQLVKIGAASLIFEQSIYRQEEEAPLCSAKVVVVAINSELKPSPIPEKLKQELERGR